MKSILMWILIATSIIFFSMWYFSGSKHADQTKSLESENKEIEKERDKLKAERDSIWIVNKVSDAEFKHREKQITLLTTKILELQVKLVESKHNLELVQGQIKETRERIKQLQDNPIKRTGDDLLKSLGEKINNK